MAYEYEIAVPLILRDMPTKRHCLTVWCERKVAPTWSPNKMSRVVLTDYLGNDVAGSLFDLVVDAREIFTDDPKTNHQRAANDQQ